MAVWNLIRPTGQQRWTRRRLFRERRTADEIERDQEVARAYGVLLAQQRRQRELEQQRRAIEEETRRALEERARSADRRFKVWAHAAFLSHPAATEEDFERSWPLIRDEMLRQHAVTVLSSRLTNLEELLNESLDEAQETPDEEPQVPASIAALAVSGNEEIDAALAELASTKLSTASILTLLHAKQKAEDYASLLSEDAAEIEAEEPDPWSLLRYAAWVVAPIFILVGVFAILGVILLLSEVL